MMFEEPDNDSVASQCIFQISKSSAKSNSTSVYWFWPNRKINNV